jgi:hypothetical protein
VNKGVILIFVVLFSCQQKNIESSRIYPGMEGPTTKHLGDITISYGYQDASVPPDYHRSYTIILTNENYRFMVDSYGEIIKDTTIILTNQKERVQQALDAFKEYKIKNINNKSEDVGCTGGNGEFIEITKDGLDFFYGSNYYCAGKTLGNLSGNISSFLNELKREVDTKVFKYD